MVPTGQGKRVGVKLADKAARFVQTKPRRRKGAGEGTADRYQMTFQSSSITLASSAVCSQNAQHLTTAVNAELSNPA